MKKEQKWSPEKVINGIRARAAAGMPINSDAVQKQHSALYQGACKVFGSWRTAVEAAGFDYSFIRINNRARKWSKQKIVAEIHGLREMGEPLNSMHVQRHHPQLYGAACNHFGNWGPALEAAGIRYEGVRLKTIGPAIEADLLDAARLRMKLGKSMRQQEVHVEDRSLWLAAARTYGRNGWSFLRRKLGLRSIEGKTVLWPKTRVIDALQERVRTGKPINTKALMVDPVGKKLLAACCSRFGSLAKACAAAKIDYDTVRKTKKWTASTVIAAIKRYHAAGISLRMNKIRAVDSALLGAAISHFGTWRSAVEAAGFDYAAIVDRRWYTPRSVTDELRRRHAVGLPIDVSTLTKVINGLVSAARRHFGSVAKAIEAAGIDYESVRRKRMRRKWCDAAIIAAIKTHHLAGRKLNAGAVEKYDPQLAQAARKYFGSWKNAVRAAGLPLRVAASPLPKRKWSRERVVSILRSRYDAGKPVYGAALMKDVPGLMRAALVYCGSYLSAARMAGIPLEALTTPKGRNPQHWSEAKVIREIRDRIRRGQSLVPGEVRVSNKSLYNAALRFFGAWSKLMKVVGIHDPVRWRKQLPWTRERILKEIHKLVSEGKSLQMRAVRSHSSGLIAAAARFFGSWGQAVETAGYDYTSYLGKWSPKAFLRRQTKERSQVIMTAATEKARKRNVTAKRRRR